MADYKKNAAIKVNYIALNRTTGLTDLVMHVYDEAGVYNTTVALVEYVDGSGFTPGGMYYGSFTPDAKGQWRIRIQSASNLDDMQRIFEIGDTDVDALEVKVDNLDSDVANLDADVANLDADVANLDADVVAVKGVVDSIEGKVDNLDADVVALQSDVTTIDGNITAMASDVTTIKGKTDNLPTDTASELTYIKNKLDSLDTQINPGGYILR